jgi:hypothetical protein
MPEQRLFLQFRDLLPEGWTYTVQPTQHCPHLVHPDDLPRALNGRLRTFYTTGGHRQQGYVYPYWVRGHDRGIWVAVTPHHRHQCDSLREAVAWLVQVTGDQAPPPIQFYLEFSDPEGGRPPVHRGPYRDLEFRGQAAYCAEVVVARCLDQRWCGWGFLGAPEQGYPHLKLHTTLPPPPGD